MDKPINQNDVQRIIGREINIADSNNNTETGNVLRMILCEVAKLPEYKEATNQ